MRPHRPVDFLARAGTLACLYGAQWVVIVLLLSALRPTADSVPHTVFPWDDEPWMRLPSLTVQWEDIDAVQGRSIQEAVSRLGSPIHVHRGGEGHPERCRQSYLYAALLDVQRVPVGLCITEEGLVSGTVGSFSLNMDIMIVCGESPDLFATQLLAIALGWPAAVMIHLRRQTPIRFVSIRLEQGRAA